MAKAVIKSHNINPECLAQEEVIELAILLDN